MLFPAWAWIKKPQLRWLFASYAESLSIRDSVKCRRLIQSDWYQRRFGKHYQLVGDQNQKQKYENDKTGVRFATSVGGSGTGEGGDIIVIDDPHKVSEAESDNVRQGVIDWWDGEMSTRGNDPKKVARIIVMQRVHQKDLAGHLIDSGGWEHLCLPAEYEPDRIISMPSSIGWEDPRREAGELLWPNRFGEFELAKMKKDLGSQRAAGQLQQRPSPAEGNVIKRHWWKWYSVLPPQFEKMGICADLTYKDKKTSDFAVFQVWGKIGADKFLVDQVRGRMGFNEQIKAMRMLASKWPSAHAKWIEDAANAAALIDTLKKEIPGLIAVPAKGSKLHRAEAISPQAESGNLYLPDPSIAKWIGDYVEEWAMFPNGAHDDQVDATSLGVAKLSEGFSSSWMPQSMTQKSKWLK